MSEERYEIREKIGQGDVGAVYCAYDPQLLFNPNKVIAVLRENIGEDLLKPAQVQTSESNNAPQEIILSQFFH